VAFAAFACGAAVGAIAIVAVYVNYHEDENAPTVGVVDRLAAASDITADATAGARKTAGPRKLEQPIQQHQARSFTTENEPLIARVPLGRVKSLERSSSLSAHAETTEGSQPTERSSVAQVDAKKLPGLRTEEVSRTPSGLARTPKEKGLRKITSGPNILQKERFGGRAGALPQREENAPKAYARGRTVFWD
jgi:hypothetical protein